MYHSRIEQPAVFDLSRLDTSTPVLVLGGRENSLSLVRRLGALGITMRVSGPADCWGMYSRHCARSYPVPSGQSDSEFWSGLLLSGKAPELKGSLIIYCSDSAIDFVARNRTDLERDHVLDHATAKLQLALLDKRKTLELARKAGVAAPQFWDVRNGEADLEAIRQTVRFPVMVKPVISHKFHKVFGRKLFIIEESFDELAEKVRLCRQHGLEVMVTEMIPGPDSLLSSYYTYVDGTGEFLFDYTKRIVRRYPENRGLACYHVTDWLPETAEAGRKFFHGIGFAGIGNIEFKRDPRDGQLKVIESNARFTAAQELVVRSGAPIDLIYYCAATGQPGPRFTHYESGLTYWYGTRDFLAFVELYRAGKITVAEWIRSLFPMRHVSPLHSLSDPYPSWGAFAARVGKTVRTLA